MGIELGLSSLAAVKVDLSQGAASIANERCLLAGVVAKVVSIVAVLDRFEKRIRCSIEDPNAAVFCIGNVDPIISRYIQNSLWFCQAGDGLDAFACLDVDDFNRVVAECG